MPDFSSILWFSKKELLEILILPLCILFGALTIGFIANRFINSRIRKLMKFEEGSWHYVFIHALQGVPISLTLVTGLYWIVNTSSLPASLVRLFSYILFTVIILSITRVIARTIGGGVEMHLASSNAQVPKTTLLSTILNILIYSMGVLVILQYYGISVAPIITTLGVGGVAVALALQETLANIFAGLHLLLSKQIRIGDYIHLSSGEEGRVTDINWRYTTIIPAGDGNTIVIPNQSIAKANISNFSLPRKDIIISIPVRVSYDSDLDEVERVTLEVAREVLTQYDKSMNIDPAVSFQNFGDSSINFTVSMHSSDFDSQFLVRHEFIKALTRRYRNEGIVIPFPTRTVVKDDSIK